LKGTPDVNQPKPRAAQERALEKRNTDVAASLVAATVLERLATFVRQHQRGKVLAGCPYRIFPNAPRRIRTPTASYIAQHRWPPGLNLKEPLDTVPDLVIEVICRKDKANAIEMRRLDYRLAGVPLLWFIYPTNCEVLVHRSDGNGLVLDLNDELSGADVLPGFACQVAELFESA
jgi:Uma2 family endonuclease